MERNIECCICRQDFKVTGYGSYVRCPYCGANLQIGNGDGSCGVDGRVTDYYDEDVEGAPGYYGFD